MNPGICLVCDPCDDRARADLSGMVCALGASAETDAASGPGWAAAAIAPPTSEPTAGACIHTDGRDVLVWAGEMFLPPTWRPRAETTTPQQAIADAVLHRVQKLGIETLGDVDGGFCGAWYDASRRRWLVFNDKLGLIPVFYWVQDDRLVVAPRAWLAGQASGELLEISAAGVVDLLRSQNMVDDHTLIEGVRWLEGGCVLEWSEQDRVARSSRYWDFHHHPLRDVDQDELIDRYVDALQQALQRHTACHASLRLGISGGLDARMLLGMSEWLGRVPACFTAGWSFSDDVRFGRRLARAAGATHDWMPLDEASLPDRLVEAIVETDGLHGVGHLAPATAMRAYLSEQPGAVLLEGYMQGVLGGAYVPDDDDVGTDCPPHESLWARYRLHSGGDIEAINGLLLPELSMASFRRWSSRVDDAYRRAPGSHPLERAEYAVASGRSGRIDVLGTALLRRDALVRTPACDRIMLDWHARAPVHLRRGKRLFMAVVRRHFPHLARVQRTSYSGLPVAEGPWLREYVWQREKLVRWWIHRRWPWTRGWGTGGSAIRAWTFQTWQRSGGLDVLTERDACVLPWVERRPLLALWDHALRDPLEAGPLLTLATVEIMARWLKRLPIGFDASASAPLRFRTLVPDATDTPDKKRPLVLAT